MKHAAYNIFKGLLIDALGMIGAAAVVYGVAEIHLPASFICAGIIMMAIAIIGAIRT